MNKTSDSGINELRRRAQEVISLPAGDLRNIPDGDLRTLVRDLVLRAGELEMAVERLRQSQAELEQSRKDCIDLYDFAPVGYFNLDSRGVIRNANITGTDMLNIPNARLAGRQFAALVEPQYQETFSSYLAEINRTGSRLSTEVEMRRGDGSTFYAQLQTVELYESGKMIYRVSAADITERKRAENALKESEQRYRDLADSLPEIIFETDLRGVVTYANRRALTSLALTLNDLSNDVSIFRLVSPGQASTAGERFKKVIEQGEDIGTYEYTLVGKRGITFPALVHTSRILREGKATGIRGIAIDITERKRAERALRESEARLRSTFDSMLEGCQIIDRSWRYAYVNEAVAKQGRQTREELLGHTMMERYPGIDQTGVFAHLKDCMENRVAHRMENEFTFPDGTRGWFELHIEPVPEGILILSLDITERKHAEMRLQRSIERLERLHGVAGTVELQPVGMLMMEHRLIERMVHLLAGEVQKMKETGALDAGFIGREIDFFRVYADRTHHGKEENILFKGLEGRPITAEHRRLMDELIQDHILGRQLISDLAGAVARWTAGDSDTLGLAVRLAGKLVEFYPAHIEKEDKLFFLPSMGYFNEQEKDEMLMEFMAFDRELIHEVYARAVQAAEGTY